VLKLGSLEKSKAQDQAWAHQNGTLEPSQVLEWLDSARARESEHNFWAEFPSPSPVNEPHEPYIVGLARLGSLKKKKKKKKKNPTHILDSYSQNQ
jgi:hypothetical protein